MKAIALRHLQADFHNYLLDEPSAIAQEVREGGGIGVDHRLHIYHNAYRVRLLANLQDAFEKTWTYLGDDAFESSALAFIEANPPTHRNLRWHGEEFPAWLARQFPEDPDIAELAMIDWHLRCAFDGLNAVAVKPGDLAALAPVDWETVGFQFAPTLSLTPLSHNSVGIWHAIDQGLPPLAAEPLPGPAWLLIWRKGWQPHFRTIQAVEHAAVSHLRDGASFAQVCADLARQFSDEEAASLAAEGLRTWLHDELIVGLTGVCA